ncbi:MAG: hypothetical protein PVF87_06085 [Acidimicrobiia bacterium]|jgi:hypothetical protein
MIAALTILHIAIASAWFGHKLLIPGDIRASAGLKTEQAGRFLQRLRRAERLGQLTGVGTLVSGAALWWAVGFETVDAGVWVGAGLVVGAILVGAAIGRPASNQLRYAVERGDRVEATIAGGRLSRVLAVESLLWVGALAAMVL